VYAGKWACGVGCAGQCVRNRTNGPRDPADFADAVTAWMPSDRWQLRRGFEPHDLDVPIAGTGGGFETLLIEDRDDAASVANQLLAL
jgi:hypothetical protein